MQHIRCVHSCLAGEDGIQKYVVSPSSISDIDMQFDCLADWEFILDVSERLNFDEGSSSSGDVEVLLL